MGRLGVEEHGGEGDGVGNIYDGTVTTHLDQELVCLGGGVQL